MTARDIITHVLWAVQNADGNEALRESRDTITVTLFDFLNAAVREVIVCRPEANAVTESVLLEPGLRQRIPRRRIHRSSADAITLIELVRNMGEDGRTPGSHIIPAAPEILLSLGAFGGGRPHPIDNYGYDRLTDNDTYIVYPPVPGGGDVWVEATYSAEPERISGIDDEVSLSESYRQAIQHHMLYEILSGYGDQASVTRALHHKQEFLSELDMKQKVDMTWPRSAQSVRGEG